MVQRTGFVHAERMLRRLTNFSIHHRRAVLITWVMLIIGATLAAGAWGGTDSQGSRLPGTDSDRAYQLLEHGVPADPNITGDTAQFVFESPAGIDDPTVASDIDSFLRQVGAIDGVVTAPPDHSALRRSADGRVVAGEFSLRKADEAATTKVLEAMTAFDRAHAGTTSVAAAGWRFQQGGVPASEGVGLLAAAIILLIAFGSVVAMGLPFTVWRNPGRPCGDIGTGHPQDFEDDIRRIGTIIAKSLRRATVKAMNHQRAIVRRWLGHRWWQLPEEEFELLQHFLC